MGLLICQACRGTTIDTATRCAHCGATLPRPTKGRIAVLIVTVIAVLAGLQYWDLAADTVKRWLTPTVQWEYSASIDQLDRKKTKAAGVWSADRAAQILVIDIGTTRRIALHLESGFLDIDFVNDKVKFRYRIDEGAVLTTSGHRALAGRGLIWDEPVDILLHGKTIIVQVPMLTGSSMTTSFNIQGLDLAKLDAL